MIFIIVDEIRAAKDVWLLGDEFLKEMNHTLRAMKMRPGHDPNSSNTMVPYLHQQYNIKALFDTNNFPQENTLAIIHNSLIRGINENARYTMPRMIIIVISDELFKMIDHVDYRVSLMIGKCIDWLLINLERIVKNRKIDVHQYRPGAVNYFEPKLIWLKMIELGNFAVNHTKATLSWKFNAILEQSIQKSESSFIMKSLPMHPFLMDRNGALTHDGRIAYWKYISNKIHDFDK